ncbi:MAG: nucleotide-binding domain containing protein, partial [Planctomycetota bacterium]
ADERDREIRRVVGEAEKGLARDRDVVVYTSRELLTGSDAADTLSIGRQVSAGLVAVVRALRSRPRCVIAKGGITSSDVATEALGMKRALVLGQVLPGVPVWRLGDESARPGLPYVVFPGNVGGGNALTEIVRMLAG